MITPAEYNNLRVFAGDVFDLNLNWKDDSGNLFDLSGWHARLRFFVSKSDRTTIDELTDGDGITLGDGTTEPNIACHKDDGETTYAQAPGYFVLEVQEPSGDWQRLLFGLMKYTA